MLKISKTIKCRLSLAGHMHERYRIREYREIAGAILGFRLGTVRKD